MIASTKGKRKEQILSAFLFWTPFDGRIKKSWQRKTNGMTYTSTHSTQTLCVAVHTPPVTWFYLSFSRSVWYFFFSSQTCYSRQIRKMRAHIIFKVRVIKLLHKSDHYEIPTRDCLTRVRVCVAHPTIILRSRSFASKPKSLTVPAAHTRYFLCFAAISYQRSDIKMLYDYFCTMTDQVLN